MHHEHGIIESRLFDILANTSAPRSRRDIEHIYAMLAPKALYFTSLVTYWPPALYVKADEQAAAIF